MSNDIRSLISSKNRAKVPKRDTALKINSETGSAGITTDNLTSSEFNQNEPPPAEKSKSEAELSPTEKMQQLLTELEALPRIGKRLAIHLEQNVRTELTTYCSEQDITPETFIEAAIVLLNNHPHLKTEIVSEASSRLRSRKRAGYLRRTISMLEGV